MTQTTLEKTPVLAHMTNLQAGQLMGALASVAGPMQTLYLWSREGLPLGQGSPKIAPGVTAISIACDELVASRDTPTKVALLRKIATTRKEAIARQLRGFKPVEEAGALIRELERHRKNNTYGMDTDPCRVATCIETLYRNYSSVLDSIIQDSKTESNLLKAEKRLRRMPLL